MIFSTSASHWTLYFIKEEPYDNLIAETKSFQKTYPTLSGFWIRQVRKVFGLAVLEGLQATEHSLARSHYWPPRGLLAAGFSPWPGSPLIKQPEPLRLLGGAHVDASLSADAGSTWPDDQQGSLPQAIPQTCLLVAGLQEHATTPGDSLYKFLSSQHANWSANYKKLPKIIWNPSQEITLKLLVRLCWELQ